MPAMKDKAPIHPAQVRRHLGKPSWYECRLSHDRRGVVVRPIDRLPKSQRSILAREACVLLREAGYKAEPLRGTQVLVLLP